ADDDGEMPIAVAQRIRLDAALVDGELEFEAHFIAGHVDQGEIGEVDAIHDAQAEGLFVEGNGARLVDDADHRVDKFSHGQSRLPGSVHAVAGVAEAGDDVALLIEVRIDGGRIDRNVGMDLGEVL